MIKVTIEFEDGTKTVYGELDHLVVRQNRPAEIERDRAGFIKDIQPGKVTTLTITAVSERKK